MTVTRDAPDAGTGQDRVRRLARLADALTEAITVQDAVTAVVHAGAEELLADSVAVCLLDAEDGCYHLAGSGGLRADMAETWSSFPADAPVPVVDAVDGRRLIVIDGVGERQARYPVFGDGPISSETLVVAPMLIHGENVIGALSVGFVRRRPVGDADRDFIQAAADLCGQAVHRARLFEYQQRTIARQRFLADASSVLARDLDHDRTLAEVARLVTDELADVCAVCLRQDDGALVTVAAVHREPSGQAVVDALVARQPVIRNDALLQVAQSGEAMFMPTIDPADNEAPAEDEQHLQLIRALDVTSGLVVPLRARGHVLGLLLMMMTSTSNRTFVEDDLGLVQDLAARAALAIDNARLYTERVELVEHLQVALSSHRAIEQAKGILATRWSVSTSTAFDRMRRHARATRRKIEEIADDVVAGRDDLVV